MAIPAFDPLDPAWLAHRYDRASDRVLYRHVPRALHREGPFLTDELIGDRPEAVIARSDAVTAARRVAGPVHFLFHSAFCGSTVLARALDLPGHAMALSEPVLLNDVTGIRRRGEMPGTEIARLLDDALLLLGRHWEPEGSVVIKPSNILTGLMNPMLALRPQARALLLYAPLRDFLASVARKGLWCRLWVRELLEGFLREGLVDLGFDSGDYFRMSDLQVGAIGWLAQQQLFMALTATHGKRIVTVASDRLMVDPAGAVAALAQAGFVAPGRELHRAIADNRSFARHSKSGVDFSPTERAREHAAANAAHRDEIEKVTQWASVIAERAGIPLTLPTPLI